MKRVWLLVAAVALVVPGSARAASTRKILVYTGNSPLISGFTSFAAAAGRVLDEQTSLNSIESYACAILPANDATFSSATLTRLASYVQGGGHLLALGDGSIFRGPNANMNAVAAAMGSTMKLIPADIDIGFHTTTNIDPSIVTFGVTSIVYAFTSRIDPGLGSSMFRTQAASSTDVIAAVEKIGAGLFILSGDTNVWSDSSGGGYKTAGNGTVVRNFCGLSTTLAAHPVIADVDAKEVNLAFKARLTESESGSPVPGKAVTFSVGGTDVCTATTAADGFATCIDPADELTAALGGGYDARYGGDGPYASSTAHGGVLHVNGSDLP